MQQLLKQKLHDFIRNNNPDILVALEADKSVSKFIDAKVDTVKFLLEDLVRENKPAYIVEELSLNELTKEFKPSKFNYIINILEEDFEFAFYSLEKSGLILYEVANIINQCEEVFQAFDFNEENEDSWQLRYAITGIISEYLSK